MGLLLGISWTGLGFTVPVIALASLVIAQMGTDSLMGDGYYTTHAWARLAGSAFAGFVLWSSGSWLNKGAQALPTNEERADEGEEENAEEAEIEAEAEETPDIHTFFSIPMQYWGFIVAIAGYFATSYP